MRSKALTQIFRWLLAVTCAYAGLPLSAQTRPASQSAGYGRLPLTFEANYGQANPQAKFLTRGRGYTAHLTTDGMVLSLRSKQDPVSTAQATGRSQAKSTNSVLEIKLDGAKANPTAVGEQLQPGVVNYFIGRNPANWHTNIPTYARVRYKSVYPGIDLVYHGNNQQLEYDFELQAGARPDQIAFEIRGANQSELDGSGNLVLTVHGTKLEVQCPVVYQVVNGQRQPVKGSYVMKDPTHVGFEISEYDRSQPLVIDPVLAYATYLGGSGNEVTGGTAVDPAGNLYIIGYTNSSDFPSGTDGLPAGANHVFVSKLNPSGTSLIYTDYLGGNGQDYGVGLVLDSSNGAFVTGSTTSSNFPTVNAYQQTQPGPYTGFLTHISADGSSIVYSTYLGGSTFDQPTSIAINQSGQVYVAGYTMSQNFPVVNALQGSVSANQGGSYGEYGFVTKFSQNGSSLVYSTYLAGSSNVVQTCGSTPCYPSPYSALSAISLDANDNAYVVGTTNTYDFPATAGTFQPTNTTSSNAYVGTVTKLTNAGALAYSTYFYQSSESPMSIASVAVDSTGAAYITGAAQSDGTFPVTTTSLCDPGVYGFDCSYAFVTKFDPSASTLLYSTFLGPYNYASPVSILLDSQSDAYVLTSTTSPQYQTVNPIQAYDNGLDVLLVEINPDASAQLFSTFLGGASDEMPTGMALDSEENVYVVGGTSSSDFPVTQGTFQTQYAGSNDGFLAKIFTGTAPIISISSTALQFPNTIVGALSQAISVQLQNLSAMPLTLSSVSVSGDFSQTNTCGNTVAAYATCNFALVFAPTTSGPRSGSLVISDNAQAGSQAVSLQGTGLSVVASLSASALTFPSTAVGSASASQSVTLTNQGNASLSITLISVSGDFSQTNNCGSSLAANASCAIAVTFVPTAAGSRTGSLTLADSAAGGSQLVSLQGTGTSSSVALSTAALTFPTTALGASSAAQPVTLTNQGSVTLRITSIQSTGDFSQTNNCPSSLDAGSRCTIQIVFSPTASGSRSGSLAIGDNGAGSPQSVALTGTGADFSMTALPASVTVGSGSTATYTIQVNSVGGTFSNAVSLACSQLPSQASCKLSPGSVTPGSKGASVSVTISTNGSSSSFATTQFRNEPVTYAAWIQVQSLGLFGIAFMGAGFRRKKWLAAAGLALVLLLLCFTVGCAGGTGIAQQSKTTPSGTYTVLVTGTSGSLKHSTNLILVVQ